MIVGNKKYSEADIEKNIKDNPVIFLGREDLILLTKNSKQKLNNGTHIPDIIFRKKRTKKTIVIVELQITALDRNHLYKALEYRDLYLIENPGSKVHIYLLATKIKDRHKILVKNYEKKGFLTFIKLSPSMIKNSIKPKTKTKKPIPIPIPIPKKNPNSIPKKAHNLSYINPNLKLDSAKTYSINEISSILNELPTSPSISFEKIKLYSIEDVTSLLTGLSTIKIRKLIKDQKLKAKKLGRKLYISQTNLAKFILS